MKEWFSLSADRRGEIFNQVSIQSGLPPAAVEKDWWVSRALNAVFDLPFAQHLVFKGGTSLSKGWNLIERFSEDIDLAIDRSFLGFEGDLSKTQVRKLRKISCAFIEGEFLKVLADKIERLEIPDVELSVQDFKDSDTDPLVIEWNYQALTEQNEYLRPRVLIEIGSRSLMEPVEPREICSLVGQQYSDQTFADKPFNVQTVLPKRTFLEKIFLLHEEFQKSAEHIRTDRLSRHLYDIEKLMDTDHGQQALEDDQLYDTIVAHRKVFNPVRGIDYANHAKDRLDFIPPKDIIKAWGKDYQTMQESMIYGESLNFEKLIGRLEELQRRMKL